MRLKRKAKWQFKEEEFMVLGLLKKGDEVLSVTNEFVAIKRKKGEVDIIK